MLDYSSGVLESAKKVVEEIEYLYHQKKLKFVLDKRDATDFSYPVAGFDRIMANHMLYHINHESRLKLYDKVKSLLAEKERFSCSLIGKKTQTSRILYLLFNNGMIYRNVLLRKIGVKGTEYE